MRVYTLPGPNDSYTVIKLPDGAEGLIESRVLPILTQQQSFSDFGLWPALIALGSAVVSAIRSRGGSITSAVSGFEQMRQYIVAGDKYGGQYLYCTDDCGMAYRLNLNKYGGVDIKTVGLTGDNPRFQCSILPPELVRFIPCAATQQKAQSGSTGIVPTVPVTSTWWFWAALLGVGVAVFAGAGHHEKKRRIPA